MQAGLSQATRQVHVRYRQQVGKWIIQRVDAHLFDRQQLPAFMQLQQQVQVPEVEGEILLDLLLARLSLDISSVSEWYHWQDETGEVQLEAYVRIASESLSYEEQRYCFYQQLLAEQVQLAEQNMRDFVRHTTSRQTVEIYLQKYQQALVRFSNQLTENLGEDQSALTGSGGYLLTDVVQLILHQVDKLSAFLFQGFAGYLDPDLPVPYSHKVLTLKQVEDYMISQKDLCPDASMARGQAPRFVNYYEANGWKVGRNPMQDCQAAANNWLLNARQYQSGQADQSSQSNKYTKRRPNAYLFIERDKDYGIAF